MIPVLLGVGVPTLFILIWFIGTYNGLVRLRNHVDESWSGIDTELKRRHDLIPNLVEVCKGYADHERTVFEQVTRARAEAVAASDSPTNGAATQARKENALSGSLGSLLAVSEAYPELKASEHFLALQRQLSNTEDRIQAARRFYNANVRDLNTRVESVPSNLVASTFGFGPAEFFEIEHVAVRAAPQVDLGDAS